MHHIKNTLPEIKAKITSALIKYQTELQQLGDPVADETSSHVIRPIVLIYYQEQHYLECDYRIHERVQNSH